MEIVIIWIIAAAIGLAVSYSIIRAAVRAALMDHYEAVQGLNAPGSTKGLVAPKAPLKWWQH